MQYMNTRVMGFVGGGVVETILVIIIPLLYIICSNIHAPLRIICKIEPIIKLFILA